VSGETRLEHDLLGEVAVPAQSLHGAHTERALENFPLTGEPVQGELARAFGAVKLACALTNRALGVWAGDDAKADAIERACRELADGRLAAEIVVDRLQGGAGTSTNMNVNEVLANRALQLLVRSPARTTASPPPTTSTCTRAPTTPTHGPAPRGIGLLHRLEEQVVALQEAFQAKEQEFRPRGQGGTHAVPDAVLTTLGREMGAYAEALNRDRWRIYKCEERLRVVNLGAPPSAPASPPPPVHLRVVDTLRELTSVGFARAENLTEATQNTDVFVEVSGILKAHAMTLLKVCGDLRLLSSGPEAGLGRSGCPTAGRIEHHAGKVTGDPRGREPGGAHGGRLRRTIAVASGLGSLELNAFLPLIADCLLQSLSLLARSCEILRRSCVEGLEADEERCARTCAPPARPLLRSCRRSGTRPRPRLRARRSRRAGHPRGGFGARPAHGRDVRRAALGRGGLPPGTPQTRGISAEA